MHTNYVNARGLMADAKFYESYARFDDDKGKYETWNEAVERVMGMHRFRYADKLKQFPELNEYFDKAETAYKNKLVLGAQRGLQFGGEQLLKNHARLYNCSFSFVDRPAVFSETFWVLLAGCGVGFSVQKHHVAKLPKIQERKKSAKTFVVDDSTEGWADSLGVLMSSYFIGGGTHPEYEGRKVYFDLSRIRPKGALISGGFKAPGAEPLRKALDKIEYLLQGIVLNGGNTLRPIHAYDIIMFAADAVLSGGVRRSATDAIFSYDDEEMMNAKIGNWFIENPQRGRSNNSVLLLRDKITKEMFDNIFIKTKEFGEPGFVFSDSTEFGFNPCFEINFYPVDITTGESGYQFCNLSEINGGKCDNEQTFLEACEAASILGTIQAGYTDFTYLTESTKRIVEREALLGVSITGWMNQPETLFDESLLRRGARKVKEINRKIAQILGINPSARSTTVKPSGNASVQLLTTSGIHAEHSPYYLRFVQMNKEQEVAQLIKKANPYMVEESLWSADKSDYSIAFPIISPPNSLYKEDLLGINLLEKVKLVQNSWIAEGTDEELCTVKGLRHNVSNTITVPEDQWEDINQYLFDNRDSFAAVSFLPNTGDKIFVQAPFTSVLTPEQIVETYGAGGIFGAGLVVDALKKFSNLWEAIDIAKDPERQQNQETLDHQLEWIRKFNKFAENYFDSRLERAEFCLKDLYIRHKWEKIQQNFKSIDFSNDLKEKRFTDIDTLGAIACAGQQCEIVF